jgi:F-type H+-transporting ATPase subunit epsilon
MKLDIITPGKQVYSDDVVMAILPAEAGEMGVLEGHAPMISTLIEGSLLKVSLKNNEEKKFFIGGGFAEINQEACIVLATSAEDLSKITRAEIEQRISKAEITLKVSDKEFEKNRAYEVIEQNNKLLGFIS